MTCEHGFIGACPKGCDIPQDSYAAAGNWAPSDSDPFEDMLNGIALTSGLSFEEVKKRVMVDKDGNFDFVNTMFNCSSVSFFNDIAKESDSETAIVKGTDVGPTEPLPIIFKTDAEAAAAMRSNIGPLIKDEVSSWEKNDGDAIPELSIKRGKPFLTPILKNVEEVERFVAAERKGFLVQELFSMIINDSEFLSLKMVLIMYKNTFGLSRFIVWDWYRNLLKYWICKIRGRRN